jgi:signal transduction histidine kinase
MHLEPIRQGTVERWKSASEAARTAARLAAQAARVLRRGPRHAFGIDGVASIARAIVRGGPLSAIVDVILDEAVGRLGAPFVAVYGTVERRRELTLLGHRNLPPELVEKVSSLSFDASSLTARAASGRRTCAVSLLQGNGGDLDVAVLKATGCESMTAVPMVACGRLVGVMTFAIPARRKLRPERIAALGQCAELCALAIFHAKVVEDASALEKRQRDGEESASIVVHDLRQPLNVLTTHVDFLRTEGERHEPQRVRRVLDAMQRAVDALNRMVGDLGDVSGIETRRLSLARTAVDMAALARDVVERQKATAPDRRVEVRMEGGIPMANGDPVRIEQVLGNLLANAFKYGEPAEAVEVALRSGPSEVEVLVTNRGAGIGAEDLAEIFKRYYRAPRARAVVADGMGLGLYISKGLVEAHGGRISVESHPGETTTFRFTIPSTSEPKLVDASP